MKKIKVKGHDITLLPLKDSFHRRALQFTNRIITSLEKLGVRRDDVDLDVEPAPGKPGKAEVVWYAEGHRMHYSTNSESKYVENLQLISKVIEAEANLVLAEKKTIEEFIGEFKEDEDIDQKRKEARDYFGLPHDFKDLAVIDQKYKELARDLHPDMPTGNVAKFKKLNEAHKTLRRELM